MTGAIVHGHLEAYFIMPFDQPKDANMECSIISRVLDLVWEQIQSDHLGMAMPRTLVVAADNTTREAKNQHFLTYLCYLKAAGKFSDAELEMMEVGHTHNEDDQRC